MLRYAVPLAVFAVVVVFLAAGLGRDPRHVPSPFIDKPAPAFALPRLDDPARSIASADKAGSVWLLNVWASWCVACRTEHPLLNRLARVDGIDIVGLNYKDEAVAARDWLQRLGDPYSVTAVDADGNVGIEWGVYGVPETFVIDKRGIVRYKHIGPVTEQTVQDVIVPMVRRLKDEPA